MPRPANLHENPLNSEPAGVRVDAYGTAGSRLVADLYIAPGGHLAGEHSHPGIRERFTVIRGRVGFILGERRAIAGPGTSVEVPPGVAHDWWNAGDEEAYLLVEIAPARNMSRNS